MKRFATLLGLAAVASATTVARAQPFSMAAPVQQAPQTAAQVAPYARPPQMSAAQPYPAMPFASPALVNPPQYSTVPQYSVPQYAAPQYGVPQVAAAQPAAPQLVAPTGPRATLTAAPQPSAPQYTVAQYSGPQYAPAPYAYGAPVGQPTMAPAMTSQMTSPMYSPVPQAPVPSIAQSNSMYSPVPAYAGYMQQPTQAPLVPQPESIGSGAGGVYTPSQPSSMMGGMPGSCSTCGPGGTPMYGAGAFAGPAMCKGGLFSKCFGGCSGPCGCGTFSDMSCAPCTPPSMCNSGSCCDPCASGCGAGGCAAGGCGPGCGCGPAWFGSVGGLVMTRSSMPYRALAYTSCGCNELLNTHDVATSQWQGGFETRIGRCLNNCCAVEAVFWYLAPFSETKTANNPGDIITALNFTTPHTVFINGVAGDALFGTVTGGLQANRQTLYRYDQFYNLEVNFLHQPLLADPTARCGVVGLAGVRWFHFNEQLIYSTFSSTNASAAYNVKTSNDLIGPQLGARCHYYLTPNLRLYALPKAGIFGNAASSTQQLYDSNGNYGFNYNNYTGMFSMIGQVDIGASWQLTPRFSVFGAYRAMGVSGVALADYQIPQYMADFRALQRVNNSGAVILQGALIGGQFCF